MLLFVMLLSCEPAPEEHAAACIDGPAADGGCPLDDCAQGCPDVDEGIACCIEAHGHGGFDASNLERLAATCSGEACDPNRYLSPTAALCVAQVHGLERGIGWCGTTLENTSAGAAWTSYSTTVDECVEGLTFGDVGYDAVQVEATRGAFLARWEEIGLAECDGLYQIARKKIDCPRQPTARSLAM